MNRIPIILIFIVFSSNHSIAQQPSGKTYRFSMMSAAGYSNYNKTFKGSFLSTDFRFPIYKNLGIVNNLAMANGREKSLTYRPNYQFMSWNIGPEIQIRLFSISNFEIASGISVSWFMNSKVMGELQQNNSTYPFVIETATYNIGYFVSIGYLVFISQRISIGLKYCISSMSKEKGFMNNAGIACQIGLDR